MKKSFFVIFAIALFAIACGAKEKENLYQKYSSLSTKWKENVTTDKYIAVFATQKDTDEYKSTSDYLLLTFTPKGKLIDSLTCGKEVLYNNESDETFYRFLVKPNASRSVFGVTQYASTDSCDMDKGESRWRAIDYRIAISEKGKVSKVKEKTYDVLSFGNDKMLYPDSIFKGNKTTSLGEQWLIAPIEITKDEFTELSKRSINLNSEQRSVNQVLAGKIDTTLMDSEILAVSPLFTIAGKVRQDCDLFMSIVFYQLDKDTGKVKPLFHYEDHRFCGELDSNIYWIGPKELIVSGKTSLEHPVYYKLRLLCLAGSYLNSVTPMEMQKN